MAVIVSSVQSDDVSLTTTDNITVDLITLRSSMTLLVDTRVLVVILFVIVTSPATHALDTNSKK